MKLEDVIVMAIEQYAQLSGMTTKEVAKECEDINSQTSKNIILLMCATKDQ